jgi:pilus assembly protein CpaC
MIKKIFVASLMLFFSLTSSAAEKIQLFAGEIKVLKLSNIERIAVGNPKIVSNSMLDNGQLLLLAEGEGITDIHVWFTNGTEKKYTANVVEKSNNLLERKNEIEELLSDVSDINIEMIGDRVVLSGKTVDVGDEEKIKKTKEVYTEIHENINYTVANLVRKKLEIEELLYDVEGLKVRIVGEKIVLNGMVDNGFEQAIETVAGAYEELMDLTMRGSLDMSMPDNKMVLTSIKITEINKTFAENLGISWDSSIAGPVAAGAFNGVDSFANDNAFGSALNAGNKVTSGYFGVVSSITSRINFGVNSGDVIILAEPRLAARSGGEASFLSGGEFPIEISNINGTSIEFKEFGIALTVKPEVDKNNNVRAKVTTELSSLAGTTVNGVPSLTTRSTEADVILASGQTLVMSGLINQEIDKSIQGIKFLKDIPILGKLFGSKTFKDNKTELVIFVTPQVFNADSENNKKAVERSKKNIQDTVDAIDESRLQIIY